MLSASTLYIMDLRDSSPVHVTDTKDPYAAVRYRRDLPDDTDMRLPVCDLPAPGIF